MSVFSDLDPTGKKELWACLAFRHAWGIGASTAIRLVTTYGSAFRAANAALADPKDWIRRGLVSPRAAGDFARENWREAAREEWEAIQSLNCSFILWNDKAYPEILLETGNAPLLLYYSGNLSLLKGPALGIVGSRASTHEGVAVAAFFSRALSKAGVTVVSGMAKGIDRAAHIAGLEGSGGTVGVLGTGINLVYPPANSDLFAKVAKNGLLISEFPPGTAPKDKNFPTRNRLISGLSRGVLVIEAAARSGSLITARFALEQGRDVFAVPGHTMAAVSEGCRELIRKGAKPVFSADDILIDLAPLLTLEAKKALDQRLDEQSRQSQNPVPRNGRPSASDELIRGAEPVLPEGDLPWRTPSVPKTQKSKPSAPQPDSRQSLAEEAPPDISLLSPEEQRILKSLEKGPLHVDDISRTTGMEVSGLSGLLLILEVRGIVRRLPGMTYIKAGGGNK